MAADTPGYRRDIDGLRGVAVLSVVLFHGSSALVPGGFTGVDVFFVISGYLISRIILGDLAAGRFSFRTFYRRRVLRIFPALCVVLLATWALGWTALLEDEYRQLGRHVAAGAGFVGNIAYWLESGYFDKAAETKPLLHLWSLGIEEQFYLLWPLLLVLVTKLRASLPVVLGVVLAASFTTNVLTIGAHAAAAFYMPFTRFWEFLLGAGLAHAELFRSDFPGAAGWLGRMLRCCTVAPLRDRLSWIGLALLLVATFGLSGAALYPGAWALLPALGALCLIAAGEQASANRLVLARRWLVFVGLISYPLYLWHWPLLSFARIVESGTPPSKVRLVAVVMAFVLAWLTWRTVERPIRFGHWPRRATLAASSMACMFALGLFVALAPNHTSRVPNFLTKAEVAIPSPRNDPACKSVHPVEGAYCLESAPELPITTAILGDSHAGHFMPGLGEALRRVGQGVLHLGEPGCAPLLGGARKKAGNAQSCTAVSRSVLDYVGRTNQLRRVIISFRGPLNVSGHGYGPVEKYLGVQFSDSQQPELPADRAVESTLARTLEFLQLHEKETWLFLEVPELGFHIDECTVRPLAITHRKKTPCAVSRAAVLERQAAYRAIVARMQARFPALKVFDPLPVLCDARYCYGAIDDVVMYMDGDHLSLAGSLRFADRLQFGR